MKYLIIAFLFLISSTIFAQSGKILYEVKVGIDLNTVDKKYVELFTEIIDYGNSQQFELLFNNEQSSFIHIDKLSNNPNFDKNTELIARTFMNSSSDVYIDYGNRKVILKEPDGTLIENEFISLNWEITTESKAIGKYLTYKATKKDHYIGSKGQIKTLEVIAWFAPILPYKFGPINHYGLPGLILELTENKTTFLATKIQLKDKESIIDFPNGNTITKEEYEKKLKAQMGM